jgi:hypothetical protein
LPRVINGTMLGECSMLWARGSFIATAEALLAHPPKLPLLEAQVM